MATLTSINDQVSVSGGDYVFKTTGALDVQIQIEDEGFATIDGGSYSGASTGVMTLTDCDVKIINMGGNSLVIERVKPYLRTDGNNL